MQDQGTRCRIRGSRALFCDTTACPRIAANTATTCRPRAICASRQTPVELSLWDALRNRRLAGLKFRRQHPIGPFVADFCCPDRRLIVELDGAVHATKREHDAEREALLTAAGYRILRFTNEAVRDDLPAVLEIIRAAAASRTTAPGTAHSPYRRLVTTSRAPLPAHGERGWGEGRAGRGASWCPYQAAPTRFPTTSASVSSNCG